MTELFSDEMKDYFKQKSKELEQDIEKNSTYQVLTSGKIAGIYQKNDIRIDVIADSKEEAKQKIKIQLLGIMTASFRPHFNNSI